jgi:ERCC4-type nuclease
MEPLVFDTEVTPRKSPPRKKAEPDDFVVCPFVVAVDTREQASWGFREIKSDANKGGVPVVVRVERKGLKTGDYSIVGHENVIAIERKEKGDLFHCMGADRERFEDQVRRLNEIKHAFLVVEADWQSVLSGHVNSQLLPKVVHRTVVSWQFKYTNVKWWFMPSKGMAEVTGYRLLERYWKGLEVTDV